MSKRWVRCGVCRSLTRRNSTKAKSGRCASCGIKAGVRANIEQHWGIGQGPGDKAAKPAQRPAEQPTRAA